MLEYNASILGLGAILSQLQDYGKPHPISYVSHALSNSEKIYLITEITDHLGCCLGDIALQLQPLWSLCDWAVKAVVETPSLSGKHTRWWMKVHSRGVKDVHIVYRAGKENVNADALSRSPHAPAPLEGIEDG